MSIQNATFGGVQGFTRKPSTPWTDDNGVFAGIVHQERNWTFIVVHDAQYLVARRHPERVSRFLIFPLPFLTLLFLTGLRSVA